jgi:hypothetical protein
MGVLVMRRWIPAQWALAGMLLTGCAADDGGTVTRRDPAGATAADCTTGAPGCATGDGQTSGPSSTTASTDGAADDAAGGDSFGNAQRTTPTGTAGAPATAPGPAAGLEHCSPGFYLGTYGCDVDLGGFMFPLAGDVSFNLEINEEVVENQCDASGEFCADLVIAEGSGTLFGLAGLTGFEAPLAGGLDCATGEFRTEGLDGIYGPAISSDPTNPDALWTVQEPPFGTFQGTLSGMHQGDQPQVIDGEWDLADTTSGTSCAGTFTVELQP